MDALEGQTLEPGNVLTPYLGGDPTEGQINLPSDLSGGQVKDQINLLGSSPPSVLSLV